MGGLGIDGLRRRCSVRYIAPKAFRRLHTHGLDTGRRGADHVQSNGPAVRLPLNLSYSTLLFNMSVTEAGTLISSEDAFDLGLFRVGPSPADAEAPVQLLDTVCRWEAAWSDAGSFYAVVESSGDSWLLQVPIAQLPQP